MKIGKLYRYASASSKVDAENRSMEFSFSSELAVDRWFGKEILSHDRGAADLSRLNDGGALLWNHNTDEMIGVVESAEIRSDKRAYCKVRFAETERAKEVLSMVQDGILKNVSFGYQVQEMSLMNPGVKDAESEYLCTKWMPYEVSFVSVPADPTVGVGRAEDGEKREVVITNKQPEKPEGVSKMTEEQKREMEVSIRKEAQDAERARVTAITALGDKFKMGELSRSLIDSGKSIDESRAAFLEKVGVTQKPITENDAKIGMTEKEIRSYSFLRAMNALANPTDRKAQEAAKFEREVSDAHAAKMGKAPQGLFVPYDVLSTTGQRDLNVTTASAGGHVVSTDLLSGSFIDLLRKKSIVTRAGASVMSGLVGNVAIPKQTGASTAYWVAESGAPTESQQTMAQVAMSPKTVGAFTDYSRRLLLQSSIDVENFVRNDLAQVIALEIDRAALYGSGASNQPSGLKTRLLGGAQEQDFAAATPTFAEVIALESKITSADADLGAMNYLVNASMQGSLKSAVKVGTYPVFILEGGSMNGYPVLVSNQIESGDIFFGHWASMMIGFWSGLDIMVDPYTGSTSGTTRIVALQDCDINIRYSEAFSRGNAGIA
jgi:HK97 family phage major capsid protein/HK97 family phage prohead protease